MKSESTDCIFCKIARGDIPSHKIYETEQLIAFLDINPFTIGHTLLIPKEHYRWIWDIPDELLRDFYSQANLIAKQLEVKLNVNTVLSMTFGELVPHTHLHIIPNSKEGFTDRLSKFLSGERSTPSSSELSSVADQLRIDP